MPANLRFWLNVILISAAHVVVITGLVRWSREPNESKASSVVWLNGSAGDGAAGKKTAPLSKPQTISTPEPKAETEEEHPVLASAKSEIHLPAVTPTPTPKVKVPPKPTPKPKPKPTASPKPSPKKLVIAKATPKPKAKATPEEEKAKEEEKKEDVDLAQKPAESPKPTKDSGSGKGTSAGSGGRIGGAGGQSQFGWYGSMLHDRFYSEWVQPTTVAAAGAKNSVLVKMRIEKDGRVSSFEIVRPSGNAAVDDSVTAAAKRVIHVDPLPPGLGNGDHYDVKINFELNSE